VAGKGSYPFGADETRQELPDPERFRGSCYRAANWMVLGRTTGRGKNAWSKKPNRPIKEVLGYPLTPHFRELLTEV
jgi:hypothetical protein